MPKKITIRVEVHNEKDRNKAMKIAAVKPGVISVSMERDGKEELVVIGDGVDSVELAKELRKKLGQAIILSVQDVKKKDDKDKDRDKAIECLKYYYNTCPPPPYYEQRLVYDVPNNSCSIM